MVEQSTTGRPSMPHDFDTPLDRAVDTRGISYDEARKQIEPDVSAGSPVDTARATAREAAHDYYAKEFNLSGGPLSPEQVRRNHIGMATVRAALGQTKKPN